MRVLVAVLVLFLALTGAATLLMGAFDVEFGTVNYWDVHGVAFLIFIAFFPRLTLLFSSVATGGILWWLGWIFAPRLLVAILATIAYWKTNPVLVVFAWLAAIGGESSEKHYARSAGRRTSFYWHMRGARRGARHDHGHHHHRHDDGGRGFESAKDVKSDVIR